MAYKQKWGVSRKTSPLNNESRGFGPIPGQGKDSETYKANFGSPNTGTANTVDVDPSRNDIVQQNNKLSTDQLLAQKSKIFTPGIDVTKSVAKEVIKKKLPKSMLSKALGFMGRRALMFGEIFLGSQSAYAPNVSHDMWEKQNEQTAKRLAESQRKKDIMGMSKQEIAEYDKNKRMEHLKWKYRDKLPIKTNQSMVQEYNNSSGPKHVFKQG